MGEEEVVFLLSFSPYTLFFFVLNIFALNRGRILFEYYKYTYHRCPSSLVLFDLAWKIAKDNNDLLW
jgi:hypothetical protein